MQDFVLFPGRKGVFSGQYVNPVVDENFVRVFESRPGPELNLLNLE